MSIWPLIVVLMKIEKGRYSFRRVILQTGMMMDAIDIGIVTITINIDQVQGNTQAQEEPSTQNQ